MEKVAQNRTLNRENRTMKASIGNSSSNELVGPHEARRLRQSTAKGFTTTGKEKAFRTDKYKTVNSSWTPVVNPYCNNQVSADNRYDY